MGRLASAVVVLAIVSVLVFLMVHLVPGDPSVTLAGENATPADIEATRERLGLNGPLHEQYLHWVGNALRGDLGSSLFTGQRIVDSLAQRLPATLSLTAGAMIVAVIVGMPGGILAAITRGRPFDRFITTGSSLGIAIPSYFVGLMLVLIFALQLRWLPATGYVAPTTDLTAWMRHLILPSIALGIASAAVVTRQLRGSLADALQSDYIRTARAKGMRSHTIVGKLGMKNAAIPVVTVLGMQLAYSIGGTVLMERIFAIPGVGQLAITAVNARDIPVIQGIVMTTAVMVIIVNFLVEISYGWLNPKTRQV